MNAIETGRMLLREYTMDDIGSLHTILSDSATMSFWAQPFKLEDTRQWIERSMGSYHERGHGRWAVILKENNDFIGDAGIMFNTIDDKMAHDLGYIISSVHWGKGLATEAATACKTFAFNKLKIERLYANMAANHIASIRVAEKIGMKKDKEFYNKRNRNILTYLYSISNTEIE